MLQLSLQGTIPACSAGEITLGRAGVCSRGTGRCPQKMTGSRQSAFSLKAKVCTPSMLFGRLQLPATGPLIRAPTGRTVRARTSPGPHPAGPDKPGTQLLTDTKGRHSNRMCLCSAVTQLHAHVSPGYVSSSFILQSIPFPHIEILLISPFQMPHYHLLLPVV